MDCFFDEDSQSFWMDFRFLQDILKKLNYMPSNRTEYLDHLVGVERQIEEIESLLSLRLNTVCIVGIWGTGGIGKTTLASAVYHKISYQFEDSYFITNVRDCGKPNWFQRNKFSTEILCHKKLLFVLDDVSTHTEIDFLIGSYDSLNLGSRIIIISRDRHVLYNCRANYIYKVNGLFDEEARKLFSLCAFKRNHPTEDYMELSYMLVRHAKGIPLVLKVLGVSLYGKRRREWESALSQLRRGLNRDIYDVLKISYDGLDDEEKKIFLDIVCFFVGEHKDYVEIFLNSKGFSTTGINVLMDKSLISLSNNKIVVHDLIQELGWDIAHQEYFNRVAGKPSFWWHHKDIGFVLGKNVRGTVSLAGISLDISKIRCTHLDSNSRMPILELFDSHAFRGLKSTTLTELRYFHLHGNPLKSSSTNFHPESLFVFDMPHSNLEQLWNADQVHNFQRLENRPQKALYLGQRKRKLNPTIELFSKLLDRFVKQKIAIEVDHGDDMYGDQSVTFITSEDCNIMFSMTELTVSCIDFYIRMLYKQLKDDDMLGQFAFINPSSVSPAGGLKYVRRGEGGRVIASCLQRATPTQLIFMPYNPRGSMDAFLMNIMQIGLTNYHSHNGNQSDKGFVQWECVQVPMQSGNFECGYYVLRFMKDIIADRSVLTENFHGKRTYTQEEIDEVRDEWTTCFLEYL